LTKPGAKYLTANNNGTQLFAGTVLPQQLPYVYNEAEAVTNTCSKLL
jgi:hypothetical protein